MAVIIDNQSFVSGLAAARVMAYAGTDDPTHAAVLLGTTRVETGGPGTQNSLAFLASDGVSPGQAIFEADGDLKLVKFSTTQAAQLLSVAKGVAAAVKKIDKDAECTVELSVVEEGTTLLVRTLTDGDPGDADSRHYIPLQDASDFPIASVIATLSARGCDEIQGVRGTGDEMTKAPLEVGHLQSFTGDAIKKMSAIAAVFKEPVQLYTRTHPASLVTITCSGVFRAVLSAHAYSPDADVDDPEVAVALSLADITTGEQDADQTHGGGNAEDETDAA